MYQTECQICVGFDDQIQDNKPLMFDVTIHECISLLGCIILGYFILVLIWPNIKLLGKR